MTTWVNAEVLIEMLDRQQQHILQYEEESRIFALSRWILFLTGDAQLAGLIRDIADEYKLVLGELTESDHRIRDYLQEFWAKNGPTILAYFQVNGWNDEAIVNAYCPLDEFETRVAQRPIFDLNTRLPFDEDKNITAKLAWALKHWAEYAIQKSEQHTLELPDAILKAREIAQNGILHVQYNQRRQRTIVESYPGAALIRLHDVVKKANPYPPLVPDSGNDGDFDTLKWEQALFEHMNQFAAKVHQKSDLTSIEVASAANQVAQDVVVVTHDLGLRLLAGRSRIVLVRRYAAKCEAFDATTLRVSAQNDSQTAENRLTLAFARFLFDQGLKPLLNPTISGLRPDVIASLPGSLLYVEAKQYSEANPRGKIVRAYKQVWGTWGRLRNQYPESRPEAFLLVFRVAGPRIELPEVLSSQGLRLYSVLVDISDTAGCKERESPLTFKDDDLLPKIGEGDEVAEGSQ